MKEIRAVARLYNNRLKEHRERLGISQREMGRLAQVGKTTVGSLESMRYSPRHKDGSWRPQAVRLAWLCDVDVGFLFPDAVVAVAESRRPTTVERRLDAAEMGMFCMAEEERLALPAPDDDLDRNELAGAIGELLAALTPREAQILTMRFGLGYSQENTRQAIAEDLGLSRVRVFQIEGNALRKLRHPCRSKKLKPYFGEVAK